jgi:RNA polymerase sigma factor (sigma-70 family)
MAGGSSAALSRDIQTLFEDGTAVGLTDRQLLDRFAGRRDPAAEAAFEALVRRHGPMVLRVCRNILPDPNDAQDAFQATFLVLVRRCGALRGLDSLGGWLYGVACRVAARARVEAARRRAVEQRAALRVVEDVEPAGAVEIDRDEFGPIVQEEVRRLPAKYRSVVVLCYWEGLTQEQAAAQLGCPVGTVRSRIARARDLLRRRLARRGLAPPAIGIEAATGSIRILPPPAPELVQSTVQAAVRVAAGSLTNQWVSGAVVSLVQRILWRTTMIKLGGIAAGVTLVGLVGYGAGLAAHRVGDPAGAPTQAVSPPKAEVQPPPRQSVSVASNVEGPATIIKIVPDGSSVKKGDVICVLDSRSFQDQLVNQRIAVKMAEAAFINAKLTREVAEIAVREYRDGVYVERLQDVQGDIKLAEAELAVAELEFQAAKAEPTSGTLAIKRAELNLMRARFSLEKAQSKKMVLEKYTYEKTVKELESDVKKAHSDELAKQATLELEVAKEKKLERQIANSTLIAPIDGRLRYQQTDARGMTLTIGEGIAVRERQVVFSIEPLDQPAPPKEKDKSPATGR